MRFTGQRQRGRSAVGAQRPAGRVRQLALGAPRPCRRSRGSIPSRGLSRGGRGVWGVYRLTSRPVSLRSRHRSPHRASTISSTCRPSMMKGGASSTWSPRAVHRAAHWIDDQSALHGFALDPRVQRVLDRTAPCWRGRRPARCPGTGRGRGCRRHGMIAEALVQAARSRAPCCAHSRADSRSRSPAARRAPRRRPAGAHIGVAVHERAASRLDAAR